MVWYYSPMRRLGLEASRRHRPRYVASRPSKLSGRTRSSVRMPRSRSIRNRPAIRPEIMDVYSRQLDCMLFQHQTTDNTRPACVFPSSCGRVMRTSISPQSAFPLSPYASVRSLTARATCSPSITPHNFNEQFIVN